MSSTTYVAIANGSVRLPWASPTSLVPVSQPVAFHWRSADGGWRGLGRVTQQPQSVSSRSPGGPAGTVRPPHLSPPAPLSRGLGSDSGGPGDPGVGAMPRRAFSHSPEPEALEGPPIDERPKGFRPLGLRRHVGDVLGRVGRDGPLEDRADGEAARAAAFEAREGSGGRGRDGLGVGGAVVHWDLPFRPAHLAGSGSTFSASSSGLTARPTSFGEGPRWGCALGTFPDVRRAVCSAVLDVRSIYPSVETVKRVNA